MIQSLREKPKDCVVFLILNFSISFSWLPSWSNVAAPHKSHTHFVVSVSAEFSGWFVWMSCRNKRIWLQFPYSTLVHSRSLPKHTSQYATMVAWIEKEVEASIMEIDPCFIGSLQRVCFKFDFRRPILNCEKLSLSCCHEAVCLMYIATVDVVQRSL